MMLLLFVCLFCQEDSRLNSLPSRSGTGAFRAVGADAGALVTFPLLRDTVSVLPSEGLAGELASWLVSPP